MNIKYDNDAEAVNIKEDGTGFMYYPNGYVSICSSQATDYQNSYYAFDKDKANSVLLAMDERGVGFICPAKRKSADGDGTTLVFTTKGGVMTDSSGKILYDWKWDRDSLDAGVEPPGTVVIRLNEHITFRYRDRSSMSLDFQCEHVRHTLEIGVKVRRTSCYLDNAKRETGGRLIPQIDHVTLKDRQIAFSTSMRAQKNKLHPKSENLSLMVRDIVGKLEARFDDIEKTMTSKPYLDNSWKSDALQNTLRDIPRIPIAGTETGVFNGFGSTIYVQREEFDPSKTLPSHMMKANGTIKNELEMRNTIMEINPPLKRSAMLRQASGRYSSALVVNKNLVTASNPTGMVVPMGLPLEHVHWHSFKQDLVQQAGVKGPLITALVMRPGDPVCCVYERIAELVHRDIVQGIGALRNDSTSSSAGAAAASSSGEGSQKKGPPPCISPRTSGFRMIRIDVSEDNDVISDLGIKTLPTFVMFSHGNIAYAGPLGGRKVKAKNNSVKPQILIVEPNAADQIKAEKTLRKMGCDTFLCLSAHEAIDRVQRMCLNNTDGDGPSVVFDMVLISEDIQTNDVATLMKRLEDFTKTSRTIVCVMVSVLGTRGSEHLHAVHWEHATTDGNLSAIVNPPLCNATNMAMQKPIKPAAVELMLGRRVIPPDDSNLGLTEKALYRKMVAVQNEIVSNGAKRVQPLSFATRPSKGTGTGTVGTEMAATGNSSTAQQGAYIGICLSAEDVKMRGRQLVASVGKTFTPAT